MASTDLLTLDAAEEQVLAGKLQGSKVQTLWGDAFLEVKRLLLFPQLESVRGHLYLRAYGEADYVLLRQKFLQTELVHPLAQDEKFPARAQRFRRIVDLSGFAGKGTTPQLLRRQVALLENVANDLLSERPTDDFTILLPREFEDQQKRRKANWVIVNQHLEVPRETGANLPLPSVSYFAEILPEDFAEDARSEEEGSESDDEKADKNASKKKHIILRRGGVALDFHPLTGNTVINQQMGEIFYRLLRKTRNFVADNTLPDEFLSVVARARVHGLISHDVSGVFLKDLLTNGSARLRELPKEQQITVLKYVLKKPLPLFSQLRRVIGTHVPLRLSSGEEVYSTVADVAVIWADVVALRAALRMFPGTAELLYPYSRTEEFRADARFLALKKEAPQVTFRAV